MLARTSLFSAFAVLLLASPALSDSISISIPNYSFESPYVANASPYASANISDWQKSPPPASWTYGAAQWYNGVGTFVNVSFDWIDNLDPSGGTSVHQQAAFMFSNPGLEISQQLTNTFQVGASYQLTVGIEGGGYGMVLGCPMEIGPYYLDANGNQVMVGTTTVLNDNSSPTGDIIHLPDRQLTIPAVAASAPWAGQNIGVALLQTATPANEGGYWDIDNVRLVATTSPTPTAVWTGAAAGNTNWSCSGNWSGVLSASGASLTFVNPGSGHAENTNDFPAGTPFAAITFAAGSPAYNLQGNAIQLSGPVANQSNINQTIGLDMQVVAGGGTLDTGSGSMTIAGAISGLSLTKLGAGSLILSGSNTYLGGTTVSGGTLSISSVGNLGGGNVALNGGALRTTADLILHAGRTVTLNATCSTIQTDNANTEIDSLLTGLGGLAKTGTGTLTLTNPANSTTGFTGGTTLFSGALEYTDPLAVDSGSVIFAGGSLILDFSGLVGSGSVATGLSQSIAIEPALAGFAGAAPALTVPSVPEPGTLGLLGAGLLAGLVVWLRRRRG